MERDADPGSDLAEPMGEQPEDSAGVTSESRRSVAIRWAVLGLAAIVFLATGLQQASRDATSVDEGVDVSSGVAALVRHDLRMVPEHPALPKAIAALPALAAHPIVPDTEAWREGDWFDWSDDFIAANDRAGRLDDVLLYARAVVLLEALGVAALLYLLAKRLFGPTGATLVALTWLLVPYVVGLSHFAMIDIPFVLATVAVCLLLARWSDAPSTGRVLALGAVVGLSLATRHTGLVLALFVAIVVAHRLRRTPKDAAIAVGTVALVAVGVLWIVYLGLSPGGSSVAVEGQFRALISSQGDASAPVRLVGALPLPLQWRAGFAYLDLTSTARPSSLLGQSWDGGAWWYFPVSALLKVPIPVLLAVLGGWLTAAVRPRHRKALLTFVVAPGLLLWLVLVAQPLNLGLRLAMPTVALALVGIGALAPEPLGQALARRADSAGAIDPSAAGVRRRPVAGLAAVGVALGLTALGLVWSAPHSLAWTPWPWHPSYRWVSDANLDAGQALNELRDWAEDHDQPWVAYDSTRGLDVGAGSRALLDADPEEVDGWVAVGVTPLMQTRREELAWLRKYCPVGTLAGGAVLVYRFEDPPDPSPGPERPVDACLGADRSTIR